MQKIRNLVYVLTAAFAIAFLDGVFNFGFSEGFFLFLGIVDVVCLVWLLILVHKK